MTTRDTIHNKWWFGGFYELGIKPDYFSLNVWNITYLGLGSRFNAPKQWTTFQISDVNLDSESVKCEIERFRQFIESMIRLVYLSLKKWNITCISATSAQKAQFCKHHGNRQCRMDTIGTILPDFGLITKKFWFIMGTSRYNCAIVNYNLLVGQIRQYQSDYAHSAVLWISGRPIAKCDPIRGQAIHHDPEVARWETQLSISRNMIRGKTCKFCVNN